MTQQEESLLIFLGLQYTLGTKRFFLLPAKPFSLFVAQPAELSQSV